MIGDQPMSKSAVQAVEDLVYEFGTEHQKLYVETIVSVVADKIGDRRVSEEMFDTVKEIGRKLEQLGLS